MEVKLSAYLLPNLKIRVLSQLTTNIVQFCSVRKDDIKWKMRPGPDLIKLFWRSVMLLQNFKPMNDDKIGHVTILPFSDWLKILE